MEGLKRINFTFREGQTEPFICETCGRSFKKSGYHLVQHYQVHKEAQTASAIPVDLETYTFDENIFKNHAMTAGVEEEEFYAIKKLLYDGNERDEISERVSRSIGTIALIEKMGSYAEYRDYRMKQAEIANSSAKKVRSEKKVETVVQPKVQLPTKDTTNDRYERLELVKQKLEATLIGFIKEELQDAHADVLNQVTALRKENEELRLQIEELQKSKFSSTLKQSLQETLKGGE